MIGFQEPVGAGLFAGKYAACQARGTGVVALPDIRDNNRYLPIGKGVAKSCEEKPRVPLCGRKRFLPCFFWWVGLRSFYLRFFEAGDGGTRG